MTKSTLSPAMAQYRAQKERHPDALLFFRMGDFYELFWEDAKLAARDLGITLTSRGKGENAIPMAGVPVRAIDGYMQKLVHLGHHVAICEQMQDPREAKGVVAPAVVRGLGYFGIFFGVVALVARGPGYFCPFFWSRGPGRAELIFFR